MKKNSKCLVVLSVITVIFLTIHLNSKNGVKRFSVGDISTLYYIEYFNDHSIIYDTLSQTWHCYGIIHPHTKFIHLTSKKLTEGWKLKDYFTDDGSAIWAPHIIKHSSVYHMYYTKIGTPREICHATSKDLDSWKIDSTPVLALKNEYSENLKNKDPMVFYNKNSSEWIMYYSVMKDAKNWVVGYSTSRDLKSWSEFKICFDENNPSPGVESPYVIEKDGKFYLFLSARPWSVGGVDVFVSDNPYFWNPGDHVKRFYPWHACEIIEDLDGQMYMTLSSGEAADDLRIAPLYFK